MARHCLYANTASAPVKTVTRIVDAKARIGPTVTVVRAAYNEVPNARNDFEDAMTVIFGVPTLAERR